MTFRELIEHTNIDKDIEPDIENDVIDAEVQVKAKKLERSLKDRYKGKSGSKPYYATLYGFDSEKEAKKEIQAFSKYMKTELGKSVGKQSNSGFMEKSGPAYMKDNIFIDTLENVQNKAHRTSEIKYFTK